MKLTTKEAFLALCAMEGEAFQDAAEMLPEAAASLREKLEGLCPYAPFRSLQEARKTGFQPS